MLGEQLKILSELKLDFDLEAIGFEVPEIDLLIGSGGHALRLGEMTQLDSRYRVPSHLARGQEAPMTSDDLLLVID